MKTYEEVKQVKEAHEAKWLSLSGVSGVGITHQTTDSAAENERQESAATPHAIVIYVADIETFKATHQDAVPDEVDGVPTELREARFLPH